MQVIIAIRILHLQSAEWAGLDEWLWIVLTKGVIVFAIHHVRCKPHSFVSIVACFQINQWFIAYCIPEFDEQFVLNPAWIV